MLRIFLRVRRLFQKVKAVGIIDEELHGGRCTLPVTLRERLNMAQFDM